MKQFAAVLVAVSLVVMVACRGPASARPDATACTVDADCTFGFGVDSDDCCLDTNGRGAGAQSITFARWARARAESAACAHVKCAPMASPIPAPAGCASEPRCRQGRCDSAC
ncbi:MAG TPA: hypothetical protein VGH28_31105 [Polyangiaceae bacterium]|jgi:hypothetical protein